MFCYKKFKFFQERFLQYSIHFLKKKIQKLTQNKDKKL